MHCSIGGVQQDYGVTGVLYDVGSVYGRLLKLTDVRKARGQLYRLETVLMIMVLAKLCGEDTPYAIADWAKNHQEQLVELLQLKRAKMPSHHTFRRIMAQVVYEAEIERLVGDYNRGGKHGEVYALDGKALRGVRKKDEEGGDYLLSVYDVEQAKVMSQVEVGRKENEITKAPQALKLVEITGKVVTADALHTQKRLSAQILEQAADYVFRLRKINSGSTKTSSNSLPRNIPSPGSEKSRPIFSALRK